MPNRFYLEMEPGPDAELSNHECMGCETDVLISEDDLECPECGYPIYSYEPYNDKGEDFGADNIVEYYPE